MSLKIVRNDISKMNTDAIVNTTNVEGYIGEGCETSIYMEAGAEELLAYRKANVGKVGEGDSFVTPGFNLAAKYIIHTLSPLYIDGEHGEEEKLRNCYRNSLRLAVENDINSIAFPLISTGSFGYPREEGLRIAVDEINAFLLHNRMLVYLVVFDGESSGLGRRIYPGLESYIDSRYVAARMSLEYEGGGMPNFAQNMSGRVSASMPDMAVKGLPDCPAYVENARPAPAKRRIGFPSVSFDFKRKKTEAAEESEFAKPSQQAGKQTLSRMEVNAVVHDEEECADFSFDESHESSLNERMKHLSDTFSQYLMYIIKEKGMENADVWKRAIVDKKVFSKIKNNPGYHPQKITALCLCVGAKLNLDETRDLLARAGYALSPCDKTDIIFSYFIEHEIYDMIEIDIQLEEHGLDCIIA